MLEEQWFLFLNPGFGFYDAETLVKLFNISEPQFLHFLTCKLLSCKLFWELSEISYIKETSTMRSK